MGHRSNQRGPMAHRSHRMILWRCSGDGSGSQVRPSSAARRAASPARGHAELAQHRRDVVVHRPHGDDQALGDLRVGQTLGEQAHHLVLALGQPGRVVPGLRPRAAGDARDAQAAQPRPRLRRGRARAQCLQREQPVHRRLRLAGVDELHGPLVRAGPAPPTRRPPTASPPAGRPTRPARPGSPTPAHPAAAAGATAPRGRERCPARWRARAPTTRRPASPRPAR